MQRRVNIIVVLICFFYNIGFTQISNAKINYKVKITQNKDINKKVDKKILRELEDISHEAESIDMQLLINKEKSIFKEKKSLIIDDKKFLVHKIAQILAGSLETYYHDIKKQTILREIEFDGRDFNIMSKFKDHDWKLVSETKIINNYNCFKAITTKIFKGTKGNIINLKVTAWYAPKISIPLGPKNYVGLPGLIMELNEGNKTYYVSKIDLKPNKKVSVSLPKKGIILTEKEFSKRTEGSLVKFINSMKE